MSTEYPASRSAIERRFALIRAVIVACAFLTMGAAGMLVPSATATPDVSTEWAASDSAAYFPAQYVNQATEIEPMPPTF